MAATAQAFAKLSIDGLGTQDEIWALFNDATVPAKKFKGTVTLTGTTTAQLDTGDIAVAKIQAIFVKCVLSATATLIAYDSASGDPAATSPSLETGGFHFITYGASGTQGIRVKGANTDVLEYLIWGMA